MGEDREIMSINNVCGGGGVLQLNLQLSLTFGTQISLTRPTADATAIRINLSERVGAQGVRSSKAASPRAMSLFVPPAELLRRRFYRLTSLR